MRIPLAQYYDLLATYLAPQRPRVAVLAGLVLAGIGLQVATPQIIRAFIDDGLAGADASRLIILAAVFIAAALAAQIVAVAATYVGETVGWSATNALRTHLADHLLRLDMSFQKNRTPGEMIQRVDGDVDALSEFFSQFVLLVVGNLLVLLGVLVVLFREDWRLGLGLGVFACGAIALLSWTRSLAVPYWLALREEMAQFYGFVGEHLTGREDLRGNGARTYAMQRLYNHLRAWRPLQVASSMWGYTLMWLTSHSAFTVGNLVALGLSYYLWQQGDFSIGSVYLVFHYTEMLRRPIEQIREQLQQLQNATAGIIRIQNLLGIASQIRDTGQARLPDGSLALAVEGVTFGYESNEVVLVDVNLHLQPGEVLGLLGRTGGGKTTLGRLIVRLYDTQTGAIKLGGVDVRDVPLDQLRGRVGVVTQDVQLFAGSVRDNLTFFDPSVSDDRLLAAIVNLGLGPWLESLPSGLDTEIAPGDLSAGEAQLLACARVLLGDPGLVILDEATSRLDPATQQLVDAAVTRLFEGRTGIVIAHRLATMDRADRVAILEDGRVVEAGARADLLGDPASRFSRLRRLDVEALPA